MKLFSIGTVVKVGIGEDLLMITTRYPLTVKDNVKGYYNYGACIYPIGMQANDNPYLFNHEDITEVIFEGYVNLMEKNLWSIIKRNYL
ncbi:DUF4176 domain-containing protein [Pelistega sp. NLN82]|uniref:DUF4176 domain-containing protein n=1 Tax=Pelistega ratti TaxID=2652177 RepID=A0A6L9Y6C0_9BURK|nr:DUF4176 domain-containing protein [Pelistega ratti]NEN76012.1 DUF4176 domain-containing protein [Pelistega ratti]